MSRRVVNSGNDINFGVTGIDAINKKIIQLYPDQRNHPQVTAQVKYRVVSEYRKCFSGNRWYISNRAFNSDGGPDPLDLVSILYNRGNKSTVPPHWHYVTFGLSDLYGDGRAHTKVEDPDEDSGFGFELTFRLKAEAGEKAPVWPATFLNSLARYVFKSGNLLNVGDHIPWKQSISPVEHSNSAIQNILLADDPQLQEIQTSLGKVAFRQVVGVTEREMKAAQQWKGSAVLAMIAKIPQVTTLLITDMSRQQSMFDLQPALKKEVASSLEKDGSNLGHVTCVCSWEERQSGVHMEGGESVLECVHLTFDANCIDILPTIAKGRLLRGRYFIFQNVSGQVIVMVPPQFEGEMVTVDADTPLRAQGKALQIFCPRDFVIQLIQRCDISQQTTLPTTIEFTRPRVVVTVTPANYTQPA